MEIPGDSLCVAGNIPLTLCLFCRKLCEDLSGPLRCEHYPDFVSARIIDGGLCRFYEKRTEVKDEEPKV